MSLRTPLASIQGYTEVARRLVKGIADEHVNGYRDDLGYALGRVHAESRRMGQLVEDMLLLARLDEGRPLDREEVDVSELIVDAVSDAHISGREHRWSLDIPMTLVTSAMIDRLQRPAGNLLSNAHPPQSRHSCPRRCDRESDGSVMIMVNDDGPGIDSCREDLRTVPPRRRAEVPHNEQYRSAGTAITRAVMAHGERSIPRSPRVVVHPYS